MICMSDAMIEFWNVNKSYRTRKADKIILRDFTGGVSARAQHRSLGPQRRRQVDPDPHDRRRGVPRSRQDQAQREDILSARAGRLQVHAVGPRELPLRGADLWAATCGRRALRRRLLRARQVFRHAGRNLFLRNEVQAALSAVSMAADFECYLLDEVLSVSDFALRARAAALFEEKLKGASLILVSHSSREVSRLCNMGAIMANGTLRIFEDVNEAVAEYEQVTPDAP